ncbi:MAG: type II secretion system F family protein [Nitrospirae bacterium]|nr:MAG: type II secretion system F family protein [Nitrospirota bacterium]
MPSQFKWKGKTVRGEQKSGEIVAESRDMAMSSLKRQGITVSEITEKKAPPKKASKKGKIIEKDVVIFTRQFSTMFSAGIPIVQGLDIMARQIDNRALGEVIGAIKADVESGSTLADSMKKHPKVFDDLFVNLVAAGEAGGILDGVLLRLANYIEKSMKLKKKVKGAMIYPAIVMGIAFLVIAIIMVFVVPVFSKIFGEMGIPLPGPTKFIVASSNFIAGFGGLVIVGVIVGIFMAFSRYRATKSGLKNTDRIALKLPVFGDLLRKVAVARFTRTLGTLISSGVPILDALEICAKTAGNKIIEDSVFAIKADVSSGKTLSEPLSQSPDIWPAMAVQMIGVGEQTGALDAMLVKIADFYDDEVDNAVNNLTTMLEPAMMVFLGTVVGFVVVALYMPIFKMGELAK